MTPGSKVLLGLVGLAAAGFAFFEWKKKQPVNATPAGNDQPTNIPSSNGSASSVTVLSIPNLDSITGQTDVVTEVADKPLRNMNAGDTTLVAMIWDGIRTPGWWPVPMIVDTPDPDASIGHVTAHIDPNFNVQGGPAPGLSLSLSTATDDAVANIDPNSPNLQSWLSARGF